ncbi:hypothetical protein E2C01_053689 [Portunus trituberculatus]|uniref:Reverse transcriptase domain-containing protein n=1 Tax=Portunus trituberculatus TaxID=210409 RepID=A0A5B7GQT2_PORTR|nr:hypothetical protein [Portunus trituberculatus]
MFSSLKLSFNWFYLSLCNLISNFLADLPIGTVVDEHCSPKSINSGVPQGSVPLRVIFLLFVNDLLNQTSYHIYSYTDDIDVHFITFFFSKRPILQYVNISQNTTTERLNSALISDHEERVVRVWMIPVLPPPLLGHVGPWATKREVSSVLELRSQRGHCVSMASALGNLVECLGLKYFWSLKLNYALRTGNTNCKADSGVCCLSNSSAFRVLVLSGLDFNP